MIDQAEGGFFRALRATSLTALLGGAAGSVVFMLYAGRHNNSRILLAIFALWVLSPFVALLMAHAVSKRRQFTTRATLYGVMLVVVLGSVAAYGVVALGPPRAKAAPVFVVVPPASWLVMGVVIPMAALLSGRKKLQEK